jgi:hypothetical protein
MLEHDLYNQHKYHFEEFERIRELWDDELDNLIEKYELNVTEGACREHKIITIKWYLERRALRRTQIILKHNKIWK